MQSIKEHNLKANHNNAGGMGLSVYLYAIYQRTQSESKSQQNHRLINLVVVCMQSIKEHNLKANHNRSLLLILSGFSVCNLSKNTI